MKEIKFRAWNKNTGKYEYTELDYYFVIDQRIKAYEYEQYTGLTDKNGKEIYEGDIVKCYSRRKLIGEYQVIWNEDCGGFECESLKPLVDGGDRMLRDVRVFNEISIQFRVVGNIHENPELLGGEE